MNYRIIITHQYNEISTIKQAIIIIIIKILQQLTHAKCISLTKHTPENMGIVVET